MITTTPTIYDRLSHNSAPVVYAIIETPMGKRYFSSRALPLVPSDYIGCHPTVQSWGSVTRSLLRREEKLILSYYTRQSDTYRMTLIDRDHEISRLMAVEPFIGRTLTIMLGYPDVGESSHVTVFRAPIRRVDISGLVITVEAIS